MRSTKSLILALLLAVAPERAGARDLHEMWDDRCFECHGHAGEFARRSLQVVDGKLQGRHHVHDLKRFLSNHGLPQGDVDAVHEMLLAQAGSKARFRKDCSGCHGTAAQFVRESIERRDGTIYGRRSARAVAEFLRQHRGMSAREADFHVDLLTRVAREVHRQ